MKNYIILSRFSSNAFTDPKDIRKLAAQVSKRIKEQCPGIVWKESYATLGRFDVIDIVQADDPTQVEKAALIIRSYGHCSTETLIGTPWKQFLEKL
ncbi:MAG: GYD domain-containing protein [Desulfobacteraceae bacterium]|nr:GYD domain-containing protein [Desulfobacteraceae bacterium]